jgi:hypothetical protein
MSESCLPITENWLETMGFRWHQIERQPSRHWLLWLGGVIERGYSAVEDLGIEIALDTSSDFWYCWLRADTGHRYSRFIHVRHLCWRHEVIALIESLTGTSFDPENAMFG